VVSVVVPPLRERREAIPILAEYFVTKFAAKCKVKAKGISAEAIAGLMNYDWPGNVRELENAIERVLVLGVSDAVRPEDLPESILEKDPAPGAEEAKYHLAVKAIEEAPDPYCSGGSEGQLHGGGSHSGSARELSASASPEPGLANLDSFAFDSPQRDGKNPGWRGVMAGCEREWPPTGGLFKGV